MSGDVKFRVYNDLPPPHTPSCCGQGQCDTFFRFTSVYLKLTLFSFQQSGEAKTKITEDVTADISRISNESGAILKCNNSVKDE
jgi:hypothetical protein